jgi:hypothetical protein
MIEYARAAGCQYPYPRPFRSTTYAVAPSILPTLPQLSATHRYSCLLVRPNSRGFRVKSFFVPVKETPKSSRKQGDWQIRRKPKDKHTETSSGQTKQQDRLSSNAVAQRPPQETSREFGESESGCYHAGVHRYLSRVLGDMEVFDHEVDVGEDGHEGNRLAHSAKCWWSTSSV